MESTRGGAPFDTPVAVAHTKNVADTLTLTPIGTIRTPFLERADAPRQTYAAPDVAGRLELSAGKHFEHALEDVDGWEYLWVLFWFHENEGWRPKVLPPRSVKRRGLFATRSPHRPNPIGLSMVRLERVDGLVLHVRGVDMLDGTPLLDIKPYVPAADARPDARSGWLGSTTAPDPEPGFEVAWSDTAKAQARWLQETHGVDLVAPVERVLRLGPQPHPYRRIRKEIDGMRLAVKDWRVQFHVVGRRITVDRIVTGYRASQLVNDNAALAVHRAFVARFQA
jgi:tRNA-Thr(GGU) m(6)t(6)A37 methyltransferase TsaA